MVTHDAGLAQGIKIWLLEIQFLGTLEQIEETIFGGGKNIHDSWTDKNDICRAWNREKSTCGNMNYASKSAIRNLPSAGK